MRGGNATALVVIAASTFASCSGGDDLTTVERWFDTTRDVIAEVEPTSDVMQIDPNSGCLLIDELRVDDQTLELFGAGAATFGDVGDRYQCAWSGDADLSANVRLEVVAVAEQPDFDEYAALIPTRADNEVISTDVGVVQVASFIPPESDRSVTTSVLVVPEQRGGVQLVVELLDPDAARDWTPEDHAELLASIAG